MSLPSLPATLTPAIDGREAIADAIYRCVFALDTCDAALFQSAFAQDAIFDLNGTIMNGFDAIRSQCYEIVSKMDTTHFITNVRVNIGDSGLEAQATCSALAQHYLGGQGMDEAAPRLLAGNLYWLELVKDEGDALWKIKKWKLKSTWSEGDWGIFTRN